MREDFAQIAAIPIKPEHLAYEYMQCIYASRLSADRCNRGPPACALSRRVHRGLYELTAGPAYHFGMPRRDFFKMLGGGVVIFCLLERS